MKGLGRLVVVVALVATLGLVSACQRTVEVQTGTRTVDAQGRVISEDIHTVRVSPETAGAYRIETIVQGDTVNAQIASLWADAQAAITAGDLTLAGKKLAEVIAISPNYRNAKAQADAIKKGEKVPVESTPANPADPSKPGSSTPPPLPGGTPSALLSWMPNTLTGFTAEKALVDPLSVSRQYLPASGSPAKSFVIVAEQFRNASDAKRMLEFNVKQQYPKNASSSTINGHTVYFGTDGRRFAAIGFTSGSVMIALEASPISGAPSTMKSVLVEALKQLP